MAFRTDVAKIERQYLLDMVDVADQQILEIGCGDGRMTWQYTDDARHVVGMDVELAGLQTGLGARPVHLSQIIDFMAGSAILMPFASASFDHVIFAWSF